MLLVALEKIMKESQNQRKAIRKYKEALRTEILRCYRVIEYLDFSQMAGILPAEVLEGYVLNDLETFEYFAVFRFQSTSKIPITAVGIKLHLYSNSVVPYKNIEFRYPSGDIGFGMIEHIDEVTKETVSEKQLVNSVEYSKIFGSYVLIPLPNQYFTKMTVEFAYAEFENGEKKTYDYLYGKNRARTLSSFDEDTLFAFRHFNIYMKQEEEHPTTVLPQESEFMWLCCCGNKNLNSDTACIKCGRDKEWQMKNLKESTLNSATDRMKQEAEVTYTRMRRSKYELNQIEESPEEREARIEEYQKVLERVAKQQAAQERRKWMIFPKLIFYFAFVYLLIFLLQRFFT